ncbi:MAG TPA: DUF2934 domain-containing protein [Polyangia bacterium]
MGKAKKSANGDTGAAVTKVSRKNALRFLPGKTAVAGDSGTSMVGTADVAQRAYHIYLEEGRPEGRHLEHWLKAESEIAGSA